MLKKYNQLMKRCIKLAKMSEGRVSPNPLVGAVIFDDDFNIISEGRHEYYGGNHAERNAVLNAKTNLKGMSIIVNLEPCSHYGKTPPCADLIIEKGIKKVIIGMIDPNPVVSGRGIEKLKKAGIEVVTGVLEEECRELNKIFIKNQVQNMPYITIKTAVTLDGKIASKTGNSKWITDEYSRKEVQKLRNAYDAVLTSSQTVIKDNPSLTCRIKNGRNPARVILDTNLKTDVNSLVYNDDGAKVFIAVKNTLSEALKNKYPKNVEFITVPEKDGHVNLNETVRELYKKGIRSILIEAGGRLNQAVINENLADDLIMFMAPKILGDKLGVNFTEGFQRDYISECNKLNFKAVKILKNDIIIKSVFLK